jgi:hypothetical protein
MKAFISRSTSVSLERYTSWSDVTNLADANGPDRRIRRKYNSGAAKSLELWP